MTLFALVVVIFLALVTFLVAMVIVTVVVVATFAELDRRHRADRLVHGDTVGLGALDHIEKPFFEAATVDDQDRCGLHLRDLLGRGLEVVRVGADRHDRDDVDGAAGQLGDDVTEDVGGDHDGRQIAALAGAGVIVVTARSGEGRQGDEQQQEAGNSEHLQPSKVGMSINLGRDPTGQPSNRQSRMRIDSPK